LSINYLENNQAPTQKINAPNYIKFKLLVVESLKTRTLI